MKQIDKLMDSDMTRYDLCQYIIDLEHEIKQLESDLKETEKHYSTDRYEEYEDLERDDRIKQDLREIGE